MDDESTKTQVDFKVVNEIVDNLSNIHKVNQSIQYFSHKKTTY